MQKGEKRTILELAISGKLSLWYFQYGTDIGRPFHSIEMLVDDLQRVYEAASHKGDVLVPKDAKCLDADEPVSVPYDENSLFAVRYAFPKKTPANPHPEFSDYKVMDKIPGGMKFDRLGPENGKWVSPLEKGSAYSVSERSLPYYFKGKNPIKEPSYHAYSVERDFTYQDVIKERIKRNNTSTKEYMKYYVETISKKKTGFLFGEVAKIDAFGNQGNGGGKQIFLDATIKELRAFGFIKPIRR